MTRAWEDWLSSCPVAHRGLYDVTAGRPENSLAAFRQAAALGVPFECDIQLTADGQLAVLHDRDLRRMTGDATAVRDLDAAALRRHRLGDSGEPIPTLDQVLAEVAGRVPMVLDVRRWGVRLRGDGLERAVADRVRNYPHPVAVQSFDPLAVWRLRRLVDCPVGQASGGLPSAGPVLRALGRPMPANALTRPDFISYELAQLPSSAVNFWRRPGRPLLAYPVESPADGARAAAVADNFFFSGYLPEVYCR